MASIPFGFHGCGLYQRGEINLPLVVLWIEWAMLVAQGASQAAQRGLLHPADWL